LLCDTLSAAVALTPHFAAATAAAAGPSVSTLLLLLHKTLRLQPRQLVLAVTQCLCSTHAVAVAAAAVSVAAAAAELCSLTASPCAGDCNRCRKHGSPLYLCLLYAERLVPQSEYSGTKLRLSLQPADVCLLQILILCNQPSSTAGGAALLAAQPVK
jgi:hypothetical protein